MQFLLIIPAVIISYGLPISVVKFAELVGLKPVKSRELRHGQCNSK